MARRRPLTGRPLLVASAGLLLGAGCGRKPVVEPVGNLMAPVEITVEVCVDVTPPEAGATVSVAGTVATGRCTSYDGGPGALIPVVVSAPGYATQELEVRCQANLSPLAVELLPDGPTEPVGNLMPPQ